MLLCVAVLPLVAVAEVAGVVEGAAGVKPSAPIVFARLGK